MVISELISKTRAELSDNAEFEAREIVMNVLGINRNELIINSRKEVGIGEIKKTAEMVNRRKNGEPLQYILGEAEFMSLRFKTSRSTLIPRNDTETLVEEILEYTNGAAAKLIDIGTGTGCIGISTAYYNKNISATLADFKEEILKLAKANAEENGVKAQTLCIDILNEIPNEKFDIIASNPPYIESNVIPSLQTEVKDFEPMTALDGGEDGLVFYRRIIELAPEILNKGGALFFEIGYNQGKAVFELMSGGFKNVRIVKDLCGNDRVITGILK